MKLGSFGDDNDYWPGPGHHGVGELPVVEQQLLWALRRMALMQPIGQARCHTVHIALQQEFGDAGLGIEHLLRCWLVGMARMATRQLRLGTPGCPMLTGDESLMLDVVRQPGAAAGGLERLAGTAAAANLLPIAHAIGELARISTNPLSKGF